jgi:hypothetical protein
MFLIRLSRSSHLRAVRSALDTDPAHTSLPRRDDGMKREHTRSQAALVVERSPERRGNVLSLMARIGERREPSARRSGLEGFLAALPRLFPARAGSGADGGRFATDRSRSTFGNDAA